MKSNKILVICGLTASGKTSLALKIAGKLNNVSLISVDSRQAYFGLPILTGQDIPKSFKRYENAKVNYRHSNGIYFSNSKINIWGVDQVSPGDTLNISDFTDFIWQVIKYEQAKNRSIIIVGGTGLYLKAVTEPLSDIHLGFDKSKRIVLNKLSTKKLQQKLRKLNPTKFVKMNQSDRQNPRRLIRAIEISLSPKSVKPDYLSQQKNSIFRLVGLAPDINKLKKNIKQRVINRIKNGAINEVKNLTRKYKDRELPIFSSLGLKQILSYQNKIITGNKLIDLWAQSEIAYAKRQQTWFKKQTSIIWYDKNSNREKLIKELIRWLNN